MPQPARHPRGSHAPSSSDSSDLGSIITVNPTQTSHDSHDSGQSLAAAGNYSARPVAIFPTKATSDRQRSGFGTRRRRYYGDPSQRSARKLIDKLSDEIWSLREKDNGVWGKLCKSYARTPGLRWVQSIRDRNESERSWMKSYCEKLRTAATATIQEGKRLSPADDSRAETIRTAMRSADALERKVPRNLLPWNARKMDRLAGSVHDQVAEEGMRSIAGPQHDASPICMNKTDTYFQCGADKDSVSQMSGLEREIRDAIKADPTRGSRRCGTVTLRASNTHRRLTTRFKDLFRKKSFSQWDPKSMCLCTTRPPSSLESDRSSLAHDGFTGDELDAGASTVRPYNPHGRVYTAPRRDEGTDPKHDRPGPGGFDVANQSLFPRGSEQWRRRSVDAATGRRSNEVRGGFYGNGGEPGRDARATGGGTSGTYRPRVTIKKSERPPESGYRRQGRSGGCDHRESRG